MESLQQGAQTSLQSLQARRQKLRSQVGNLRTVRGTKKKQSNRQQINRKITRKRDKIQQLTKGIRRVQQVQINNNGQLDIPYDDNFSIDQLNAFQDANDQLLQMKMAGDQQALQYGQHKRDLSKEYDEQRLGTLNQNAASGTAFSSKYGTAVTNDASAYANQLGDLEQGYTSFQQNQALQKQAIQHALQQQLALGVHGAIGNAAGNAGTLGYGKAKKKTKKGRNSSAYKNKKKKKKGKKAKTRPQRR